MIDIAIVAVIGVCLAGILWKKVKDYKSGKGGCGCGDCAGCGGGCAGCFAGSGETSQR